MRYTFHRRNLYRVGGNMTIRVYVSGAETSDDPMVVRVWISARPDTLLSASINSADVFVGIYSDVYSETLTLDYQLAQQADMRMMLFASAATRDTPNLNLRAFLGEVAAQQVITYYDDSADLLARLRVALQGYKQIRRQTGTVAVFRATTKAAETATEEMPPEPEAVEWMENIDTQEVQAISPPQAPSPEAPAPLPVRGRDLDEAPEHQPITQTQSGQWQIPGQADGITLTQLVDQALELAEDDLEVIIRRALEVHEAQRYVMQKNKPHGWLSADPIFGPPLENSQFQSDIFMIMPFRERFNGIYESIIKETAADLNLVIKRGDDFASRQGSIIKEVWAALNACRLVIAETTEINANVYYELGIAHTLGKPAILLTQATDIEDIPFDIRHLRFIQYEDSIEGGQKLADDLRRHILWVLNDLKELPGSA